MNFLIEILKAIFGATTYKYRLFFANRKDFVDIDARDFIDAKLRGDTMFNLTIAYITPLENVKFTKGEIGSNFFQFETVAKATVFGENEDMAKQNFSRHVKLESVKIVEVKTPIWVNKAYYKGVNNGD